MIVRMPRWALLGVMLLASACAQAAPPEATDRSPTTEPEAAVPADRYAGAPRSSRSIARLLMARHKKDLPGKETLARHEDAEASLGWLAEHGRRMVVRVRALAALRFYAGNETRQVLLRVLRSTDAHPALRAAAITGSGGFDLRRDSELRAVVQDASRDGDPRIARALERRMPRD